MSKIYNTGGLVSADTFKWDKGFFDSITVPITYTTSGITFTHTKKDNFEIERVIFNAPATIVIWKDGSKTVVKAQDGDTFNKEFGLAMAFMKRALNNKGNFNNTLKKWCVSDETEENV